MVPMVPVPVPVPVPVVDGAADLTALAVLADPILS